MEDEVNKLIDRLLTADKEYRAALQATQEQGAEIVRAARRTLGLTQRDLADKLKLNFTYISKIENGHTIASKRVLRGVARLLSGVNVDERRAFVSAHS